MSQLSLDTAKTMPRASAEMGKKADLGGPSIETHIEGMIKRFEEQK
jgi:hypothetical protein